MWRSPSQRILSACLVGGSRRQLEAKQVLVAREDWMNYGTIVMLNGTSSAGKTSIISALQDMFDEPYLHAGIDRFFHMLPPRYLWGSQWTEALDPAGGAGPVGRTVAAGMHSAIVALARAGNHVLVDHVFLEPTWVFECAALFTDIPAYLIGVRCALAIAEQREQQRRDRAPGQARAQFDRVHLHAIYDFEVDTAAADAAMCAAAIKQYLSAGAAPSAFQRLLAECKTIEPQRTQSAQSKKT
jgi:chloramphenicol 3-O phosphotransferase